MLVDGPYITEREVTGAIRQPAGTGEALAAPVECAAVERQRLVETLASAAGNKQAAARVLGISRRALYRRLERYGLHTTAAVLESSPPRGL
jgi:transcriptional regulator of acetoin/glycerol metabolism